MDIEKIKNVEKRFIDECSRNDSNVVVVRLLELDNVYVFEYVSDKVRSLNFKRLCCIESKLKYE